MHIAIRVLLIWCLIGSIIPCAIIAAPMFLSGKYTLKTKLIVAAACWPQLIVVAAFGALLGGVMALRQRLHPQTRLPPATPPSDGR